MKIINRFTRSWLICAIISIFLVYVYYSGEDKFSVSMGHGGGKVSPKFQVESMPVAMDNPVVQLIINPSVIKGPVPSPQTVIIPGLNCLSPLILSNSVSVGSDCDKEIKFTFSIEDGQPVEVISTKLWFSFEVSNDAVPYGSVSFDGLEECASCEWSTVLGTKRTLFYSYDWNPGYIYEIKDGDAITFTFDLVGGCIDSYTPIFAEVKLPDATPCAIDYRANANLMQVCPDRLLGYVADRGGLPAVHDLKIRVSSDSDPNYHLSFDITDCDDYSDFEFCVDPSKAPLNLAAPSNKKSDPTARKDKYLCGVTTYDLLRISRHLNTTQPFTSFFEYVAADVDNKDPYTIDVEDITELRKLILGNIQELTTPSFRYIRNGYPQTGMPGDLTADNVYTFLQVPLNQTNRLFTEVKMGDVSNNCACGMKENMKGAVQIVAGRVENRKNTEQIEVPVFLQANTAISAFQSSFFIDPSQYEILKIVPNYNAGFSLRDFNLSQVEAGTIKLAWIMGDDERAIAHGELLFTLIAYPKKNAEPFRIHLQEEAMPNLAYHVNGDAYQIQSGTVEDRAALASFQFQPIVLSPNPMIDFLRFHYYSEDETQIALRLYDLNGRLTYERALPVQLGNNQLNVKLNEMPSGVYIAELHTANGVTRQKLQKI